MPTTKWMRVVASVSIMLLVMAGGSKDGGKDGADGAPSVQESRRNSLKGLVAVYLLMDPLDLDAQKAGLSASQLRTDVELRLRAAGIPVLTEKQGRERPGDPYLYLDVSHIRAKEGFCAFSIRLALIQNVFPQRNPTQLLRASTWSVSTSGYVLGDKLSMVRQTVRDFTDRFCNDYLAVNQKDPSGKAVPFDFKYAGPLEGCKRWGKPENYIHQLIWDYKKLRSHFSEGEVLHAAGQACKERVNSESELADCRACVQEIITALYRDKEGL